MRAPRPPGRLPPRTLLELAAAAGAALLLERFLPPLAAPALRATLVFAPLPVALFADLARRVPAGRARPLERVAGAVWALAALRHDELGLPFSAAVLGALFFVLVGWRAARLALALRPALGRGGELAPFVLLPAAVYFAVLPWVSVARPPDGDEPYYLLLAHSLAEDFDVDLADEYRDEVWRRFGATPVAPQPGDPVGPGGEVFSRHEPLLPLLLAPAFRLGGLPGAQALLLALAALAAGRFLGAALAEPGVTPRGAFRAWVLFAFAPPLLLYSHQIWVEVPAALALVLVLEARGRLRAAGGEANARDWLRLALPLAALPLLKLRLLLVAAPLTLLALPGLRRSRRLQIALAAALALLVGGLLLVNQIAYGNPLKLHSVEELALYEVPLERFLRGGVGLFFDVAFGLLAAAPIWLLALPAVGLVCARAEPLALELGAVVPYLAAVAARREWYGGWSPPFRYGLVVLPLLALAVARLLSRRPPARARALAAALAALSVALAVAGLVVPGWTYNLADGGSHLLDALAGRFPGDLVRLFPSAVRPRAATWLVPLAATALAGAAFAFRGARRPRRPLAAAATALCLGWVLTLVAAHVWPSRSIELEDSWVAKRGGMLYPERWVIDRTRFRGGWVLVEGAEASVRPVAGGREAIVLVDWSYIRNDATPLALEVEVGSRLVARWPAENPGRWRRSVVATSWPTAARLLLRAAAPVGARPANGLVVDRVELVWR